MPEFPDRYRKRPIEVEAMQLTAESTMDLIAWIPPARYLITDEAGMPALWVYTRHGGRERVRLWDWVVREGESLHVYPPKAFESAHEAISPIADVLARSEGRHG